uniref:Uncharacterized protein n=1 Tax=Rhizophora mucronata TaxID=61149 RepID=A0A2P2NE34_RHIMU
MYLLSSVLLSKPVHSHEGCHLLMVL